MSLRRLLLVAPLLGAACTPDPGTGPRRLVEDDTAAVETDAPHTDLTPRDTDPGTDTAVDSDTDDPSQLTFQEALSLLFRDLRASPAIPNAWIKVLRDKREAARLAAGGTEPWSVTLGPHLTADLLGGAKAPTGTDPADQIAVAAFTTSTLDFDDHLALALDANQVCIATNSTVYHRRTYTSNCAPAAFRTGGCSPLVATAEVHRKLSFLAAAWLDLHEELRLLTLPTGGRALLARTWTEEVVQGHGGGDFRQEFTLDVWVEEGGSTWRASALWVELDLGLDIGSTLRNAVTSGFAREEAFATDGGSSCGEDRDAAYTRDADEAG